MIPVTPRSSRRGPARPAASPVSTTARAAAPIPHVPVSTESAVSSQCSRCTRCTLKARMNTLPAKYTPRVAAKSRTLSGSDMPRARRRRISGKVRRGAPPGGSLGRSLGSTAAARRRRHGTSESPGRSRTRKNSAEQASSTSVCVSAAARKPEWRSTTASPAAPIASPASMPARMNAFTRARSSGRVTVMAIASALASCTEAHTLCTKNTAVSSPTCCAGSRTSTRPSDASRAATWAKNTHGLRRPIGEPWNRSITGPQKSCTVHGTPTSATNRPMVGGAAPAAASRLATAVSANPAGTPCMT